AALEAALVRAAGVPARIAVGLAVPTGVAKGEASERRTWVEVLAPEAGWVPLDALAAGADALAGAAPGAAFDRLHVTTGCGLVLGDGQRDARPLPSVATTYVEVDGRRVDGGVETHFPFADLATAQLLGP
ncbi:MAG: transglutaminase domain-containing protein, partial [Myxococcales bacterium]|nr:transglutaminase domain-containing protein [Myxococcales bacterium]